MFGLSFADIIASIAIALTTLPMPKDVIYPFSGPSYGTIGTCEAQGFLYIMGSSLAFCMMAALNVYYACTLSFNVREEVFRRYIEPVFYVISITTSVITPTVVLLKADMLNPGVNDPFCGPAIYPEGCNKEDDPDCRGTPIGNRNFLLTFIFALTLSFGTLIITMGSVIYTFYKREKRVKEKLKSRTETTDEDESKARELEHAEKMTRIITKQALMYIGAFVITWIMPMLSADKAIGSLYWVQVLRMIFQPLQGFFNMLIFFYHKVSILVRHYDERTVGDALRIIFLTPRENPDNLALSNLDVIYEDEIKSHLENQNKNSSAGNAVVSFQPSKSHNDGVSSDNQSPKDAHLGCENCDSSSASAIDSTGLYQDLSYASQSLGGYSSRIDRVSFQPSESHNDGVSCDNQPPKSPKDAHLVISDGSGENCDSSSLLQ